MYSANSIQCSNALYNKITQSKKKKKKNSDTIINTTIRIKWRLSIGQNGFIHATCLRRSRSAILDIYTLVHEYLTRLIQLQSLMSPAFDWFLVVILIRILVLVFHCLRRFTVDRNAMNLRIFPNSWGSTVMLITTQNLLLDKVKTTHANWLVQVNIND